MSENDTEEEYLSLPDPDESGFDDLLQLDYYDDYGDDYEEEENDDDGELSFVDDDANGDGDAADAGGSVVMDGRMPPKKKQNGNSTSSPVNTNTNTDTNGDDDGEGIMSSVTFSDYILGTLIVRVVAAKDLKPMKQNNKGSGVGRGRGGGGGGNIVGSLKDAIFNKDKKPSAKRTQQQQHQKKHNNNHSSRSRRHHHHHHHHHHHDGDRRRRRGGLKNSLGGGGGNMYYGSANPFATLTFADQIETTSTVYDTLHPSFPRNEEAYFDVSLPITHLAHEHQKDIDDRRGKHVLNDIDIPLPPPPQLPILNITLTHNHYDDDDNDHYYDDDDDDSDGYSYNQNYNRSYKKSTTPTKPNRSRSDPVKKKNMNTCNQNDDQNDNDNDNNALYFLGQASIDVTHLITGKTGYIDQWLTLNPYNSQSIINKDNNNNNNNNGNDNSNNKSNSNTKTCSDNDYISGQIRIICEYDMTDLTPRPGDLIRFNGFVNPMDVYPMPITQVFRVDNIGINMNHNNGSSSGGGGCGSGIDDDILVLSYKSKPENWYCTFVAHRFMFISVERHITAIERYQDELVDILSKLVSSPAAHVVQQAVARLPEEGLLCMGLEASMAGIGLAGRWFKGGVSLVMDDIVYAGNLDGKSATTIDGIDNEDGEQDEEVLSNYSSESDSDQYDDDDDDVVVDDLQLDDDDLSVELDDESGNDELINNDDEAMEDMTHKSAISSLPSPSMPCCPISGQPMKEPVVAADGHTYEKKAISRWFRTSNISPLTGKELPHKELVPNYLLISTFQVGF